MIDFHQANKRVCDTLPSHLQDLFARSTVHLKTKEDYALKNFLIEYADVFAKSDTDLGRTSIVKHTIDTQDARTLKEPPRRVLHHLESEINQQIDVMLEKNIIEKSVSPWASGMVLAKKKDG